MPEITSDNDLPKPVNTPAKRVKLAKKLIDEHLGSPAKRLDNPPMQGMFSRTLLCTLKDGREIALQFRNERLDVGAFNVAREALGSVVPECQQLPCEELDGFGIWIYWMPRMPGKLWVHGVAGKGAEGRIAINKSLGQIFSKGFLAQNSSEAISKTVRPHLDAIFKAIQVSSLDIALPYQEMMRKFYDKLDDFAKLPLWIAHYDINEVNILVNEECKVTALIDWELSSPLPFGVGFGRIHTIAGEFTGGEFWVPPEFEAAERGFWEEMFNGMPADIRSSLEGQMGLFQDAVILGTLLECFSYDNGKVWCNAVSLKALPKFPTYRLPFVTSNDTPYSQ